MNGSTLPRVNQRGKQGRTLKEAAHFLPNFHPVPDKPEA
jgi:hypothetical protein